MMEKRKLFLSIMSTICITLPTIVNAAQFGVGYAATGDNSITTPTDDTFYTYDMGTVEGTYYNTKYTCNYDYTYGTYKTITINGYDIDGKSLMENSINISPSNAVLAGTAIGINLYETKRIYYEAEVKSVVELSEYKLRPYTCTYKRKLPPQTIPDGIMAISNLMNSSTNKGLNKINISPIALSTITVTHWLTYGLSQEYCKNNNPHPRTYEYYDHSTSPINDTIILEPGNTTETQNTTYRDECEKIAVTTAIRATGWTFNASYNIKMTDSNDINETTMVEISKDDAARTIKCANDSGEVECTVGQPAFSYTKGVLSDSITATFEYKKDKVCMNLKTSKVTYRSGDCITDEIAIPNKIYDNKEYWNYFIPLNARSDRNVEINMLPAAGGGLTTAQCNYVMKNNPVIVDLNGNIVEETLDGGLATTYLNLINPTDTSTNTTFNGDYCQKTIGSDTVTCNESSVSSDYTQITRTLQAGEYACYLTSKIKIPIKQRFYNEVTSTTDSGATSVKFNGFNFYYKPIDVSDAAQDNQVRIIFPNGVNKDIYGQLTTITLWDDWYKAQNDRNATAQEKTPDLSNSYSNVTYYASNINSSTIRSYNQNNQYTSWSNMNLDGTSKYIDSEGIIQRVGNSSNNIYKLGCGPANINEYLDAANTIKNSLYIEGCGN